MGTLNPKLRVALDLEPLRPLLEYAADRLGLNTGQVTLELRLVDGRLSKAYAHRGPIGVQELEELAAREPPPLPS